MDFLAHACPQANIICDNHGDASLQAAIYGLTTKNMIDSIINASPEAAFLCSDKHGNTPFDNYFNDCNVFARLAVDNQSTFLNKATGIGNWKYQDIYDKGCRFLEAAICSKNIESNNETSLLHIALRKESCHWAFCKLLMTLQPEQVLNKDSDGNLPIHIILASRDLSDEDTFTCFDCFTTKPKLMNIKYMTGESKHCCEDCYEMNSKTSMKKLTIIEPGA